MQQRSPAGTKLATLRLCGMCCNHSPAKTLLFNIYQLILACIKNGARYILCAVSTFITHLSVCTEISQFRSSRQACFSSPGTVTDWSGRLYRSWKAEKQCYISCVCVVCVDAFVDAGPSNGLVRRPLHGGTGPVRADRTGLLLRTLLTHYQILQLQGAWHFLAVIWIITNMLIIYFANYYRSRSLRSAA